MSLKKYYFSEIKDIALPFIYFFIFVYSLKWFVLPRLELTGALEGVTFILFIIFLFIGFFIFTPKVIAIVETSNNEIRFFNPFSNRWAPIHHYRFIADGPDFKKVIVYKRNCKKLGKIGLKRANAEEKMEFLKIIEPYLTVRGVGSDFSLTDVKD